MFILRRAANKISTRAKSVADLNLGSYVPGLIKPSVILNAFNGYPFAHSDKEKLTFVTPVSHSIY